MKDETVGRLFVAAQVVLLVAIVLLPTADHWGRPIWLLTLASICIVAGIVIIAVAALGLGGALTASPVPNASGELHTDGLYRLVRHPIYTGVLLAIAGAVVRSGNAVMIALAVVALAFFTMKASWEERRLTARYPGYETYAARTPRFIPRPWPARLPAISPAETEI